MKPAPMNDSALPNPARKVVNVESVFGRLMSSLDRVEAQQAAALHSIEQSYDAKAKRIRGVLSELGVDAGKAAPVGDATGGPFVAPRPVQTPAASSGTSTASALPVPSSTG